jgi:hypothetical protein
VQPVATKALAPKPPPLPMGIVCTDLPGFGQSLSRLRSNQAILARLTQWNSRLPIEGIEIIIFVIVIFLLTVINVLLYSKYAMALDHYSRTVMKRLSGGL